MTTNDEGAEALLELRPLRLEDFDRLVALELACFPRMKPWSREQFESQLATYGTTTPRATPSTASR